MAMTAKVPIIDVADTAFTTGQARRRPDGGPLADMSSALWGQWDCPTRTDRSLLVTRRGPFPGLAGQCEVRLSPGAAVSNAYLECRIPTLHCTYDRAAARPSRPDQRLGERSAGLALVILRSDRGVYAPAGGFTRSPVPLL